jgi:hypothetical protein
LGIAETLVSQFDRLVRRDGGSLTLLDVQEGVIRVGYHLGTDPACVAGVCAMPYLELQTLMAEALSRRAPEMRIQVVPLSK